MKVQLFMWEIFAESPIGRGFYAPDTGRSVVETDYLTEEEGLSLYRGTT